MQLDYKVAYVFHMNPLIRELNLCDKDLEAVIYDYFYLQGAPLLPRSFISSHIDHIYRKKDRIIDEFCFKIWRSIHPDHLSKEMSIRIYRADMYLFFQ